MSADLLVAYCQRTLGDIVTLSDRIRCSAAVAYRASSSRDNPNFGLQVQEFCHQIERIRTFSDTTLQALTFDHLSIDERLVAWLFSGEQQSCLDKLSEIVDMLKEGPQVRPATTASARHLRPPKDRLAASMAFFVRHRRHFHFLLTTDIWDRERVLDLPSRKEAKYAAQQSRNNIVVITASDTETDYHTAIEYASEDEPENGWLGNVEQAVKWKQNAHRRVVEEVVRWLDALDCMSKHRDTLKQRQEGTCTWFSTTGAYQKWRPGGYQFLWLNGKAGCGKSVFAASTIEYLKDTLQDGEVLVFFYCDFRNQRSMIPTELMRSLLSQLFCHMLQLPVDCGDLPSKILQRKSEGTLSLGDLDKLCELVWLAARHFNRLPIVIIDALDECSDVDALSRALVELSDDVRLLVTSRADPSIQRRFALFPSLSMEDMTTELSQDIALHIRHELDSCKQLRSTGRKMKIKIAETLIGKADGRFRWVRCQLDALDRCPTESDLRNALSNLPEGLEETYEKILETIDERKSEGEAARRTLGWLVVALAPLRIAQIADGFSVDLLESSNDSAIRSLVDRLSSLVSYSEDTDVVTLSHFSVKEYLLCRTTLPTYHIVPHVAHGEVARMCMRYLSVILKQPPSRLNLSPKTKFPVLSYVLSFGFDHLAHVHAESFPVLNELKLLGSDVRNLPSHWECLCELREDKFGYSYPPWPSFRHDFELYILIAYPSPALLESFLLGQCLNPRLGTNALVYAVDLRKTKHAIVLLRHGADVNMRSLAIDDSHRPSPLEVAIDRGDDVIVGELLNRGCLVTAELLATAVFLPWCNTRVLVKLTRTDEFATLVHEISDLKLFRGIFSSARPDSGDSKKTDEDHAALTRRLHELGQNLSADSPFGAELVERAVQAAHTLMLDLLLPSDRPVPSWILFMAATGDTSETVPIVSFLLRRGADVRAVTPETEDSALHLAVRCSWEPRRLELVKILIAAGCDPHLRNSRDETPFELAVKRGYISVAEVLLPFIVSLPPNILLVALQRQSRNAEMIQWLLLQGANIHATTSMANTVLHLVIIGYEDSDSKDLDEDETLEPGYRCESDCLGLVRILVEAGCKLTARNSEGKTALEIAIKREYISVLEYLLLCIVPISPNILLRVISYRWLTAQLVQSLLHKGADVRSTEHNGDTILHLAIAHQIESRCLEFVKTLVEAGCNPATCNLAGNSVLDAAIAAGYSSVVDQLLSCEVPFPHNILAKVLQYRKVKIPEMIRSFLRKGADVHFTASNGDTILHLAITHQIESRCLELVKIFINAGCNPAIRNLAGNSVLDAAITAGYSSVVDQLLSCEVPFPHDILPKVLRRRKLTAPEMIRSFLRKSADTHSIASNGDTMLHLTITHSMEPQCLELVKMLIEAGCNPTAHNSSGESVLETAITVGYSSVVDHLLLCGATFPHDILPKILPCPMVTVQIIQSLLCKGADLHLTTSNGDTVLHLALGHVCEEKCLQIVKTLIEAGCDPTAHNSQGTTVMMAALTSRHVSVVEHLISCNIPLPFDILPRLVTHPRFTVQMLQSLIRNGANVHPTLPDGATILHVAITSQDEFRSLQFLKIFIEAGCDPTACDSNGRSVLAAAVDRGYSSVADHLLSCNVPFSLDTLPGIMLCHGLTVQMVQPLLGRGVNVHSTLPDGNTVLHLAISHRDELDSLEFITTFIEAGCNPAILNSDGKSTWEAAMKKGYISVVEYLLSCNAPFPLNILPRIMPYQGLTVEMVQTFLRRGANVHSTTTFNGDTVLHRAIAYWVEPACLEFVKVFVEAGCNPATCNSEGKSAWEPAMQKGYASVVEFLLMFSAPFPPDILQRAMRYQSFTTWMAQSFLCQGANVHSTTPDGNTVLHLAIVRGVESVCLEFIEMFVEAGCNPHASNIAGKSGLDYAVEKGYNSVAEFLRAFTVSSHAGNSEVAPLLPCGLQVAELPTRDDGSILPEVIRDAPVDSTQ